MRLNFLEKSLVIWGLFWGVLGFGIYFLGLLGLFNKNLIIGYFGLLMVLLIPYLIKKKYISQKLDFLKKVFLVIRTDWILLALSLIALAFFITNFILALAPETEFDALWYHLTLPKIYLQAGSAEYIRGGLLYYSVMPRLVEMFYGFAYVLNNSAIFAKLIHYFFGLAWFGGTFIFAREYLNRRNALLAALAIYGLYLTTWLSQTAYIDMAVGFFVIVSLWGLVKYFNTQNDKFLYLSAIFMGLNLSSKTYGLMIFAVVMFILLFKSGIKKTLFYFVISLIIVSPFYLQALLSTGNPIYPVFSVNDSGLRAHLDGKVTLGSWYKEVWFLKLPSLFWDVIVYRYTPVFGLVLAIFLIPNWKKMTVPIILFIGFFLFWSLVPVHEPRYFMVILPVLSLIIFYIFQNSKSVILKTAVIILFTLGMIFNISKTLQYFPETFKVAFGKIPEADYLEKKLYRPQTFYDSTGNLSREVGNSKVLTLNIHNLFYLPYKFTDWTFIENEFNAEGTFDEFMALLKKNNIDYVLTGDTKIEQWQNFDIDKINKHFDLKVSEHFFNLYKVIY